MVAVNLPGYKERAAILGIGLLGVINIIFGIILLSNRFIAVATLPLSLIHISEPTRPY